MIMIFLLKFNFDERTKHPKFDLTGVRTHDLQIMNSIFHIPETLVLFTDPSRTYTSSLGCIVCLQFSIKWSNIAFFIFI